MSDEVNDFLAHYGVKGMKWGVRKDRDSGAKGLNRSTSTKGGSDSLGAAIDEFYASKDPKQLASEAKRKLQAQASQTFASSKSAIQAGRNRQADSIDGLKSKGYSALVDDMDAGYFGDLPVVFFGEATNVTARPRTAKHHEEDKRSLLPVNKQFA